MSEVILNKYDVVLADKNEWEAAAALAVSKGYIRVGDKLEAPETGALVGHWSDGTTSAKGGWVSYVEMTNEEVSDFVGVTLNQAPKGLPPLFDDEDDDDDLGESVYVIIKFKGFAFPVVGVYCHKIDGWQFNGDCDTYGTEDVEEWWPMPVIGTGTAPEIKKEGE